jgi:hypothetical protein
MSVMWRAPLLVSAATSLLACGNVKGMDSPADAAATPGDTAVSNPCAPGTCLLADDFNRPSLDTAMWGTSVGGGATVTQTGGHLTLHVPAVAGAFADVYSLIGFPAGTTLEASVTFSAGQVFDHKGAGFASSAVSDQCNVGETDAAMFRGQDGDGYIETKVAGVYSCNQTVPMYPGGTNTIQIERKADQVVFHQNNVTLPAITNNLPAGLLPVRFSAYTYTMAPTQPVQIDVDYVLVKRP